MGPKRSRVSEEVGASSSNPPRGRSNLDRVRFTNMDAQERFLKLKDRAFIEDRGIDIVNLSQTANIPPAFASIRDQILNRQWTKFVDVTERGNQTLALEFLANWPEREDGKVRVRGVKVPASTADIHALYELPTFTIEQQPLKQQIRTKSLDYVDIAETLGYPGLRFHTYDGEPYQLFRCELNQIAKAWLYFVSARLLPNKHFSDAQIDRLKYVYGIMKGYNLNVGDIIRLTFDIMVEGSCGGGLGLAGIITDMCEKHGVPQYSYDTKVAPQRSINLSTVMRLKPPHPHGQPPARGDPPAQEQEEHDDIEPPRLVGPLDPAMQYTHNQLNYLIQQNMHMQNYMAQRSIFDEQQVAQLNTLVTRMNIGVDDPNYFPMPPRFNPYDQPPPPNPF
ncbi:hypothetical protein CsatB_000796 [Cannabis sativa]